MSYKTKHKPRLLNRGRHRKKRSKTFASEEAAKKYVEQHKIKKYFLKDLRPYSKEKKIRLILVK